jgi:hypothetical protein
MFAAPSPPIASKLRKLDERFAKRPPASLGLARRKRTLEKAMTTFAVIAKHPPELCPTSNAQTRQMLKQGAGQIPQLAEQLGVDIVTLRIFGPDHIVLAVVEAEDIEAVRNFVVRSRLIQWNTTSVHPTYSMEEAVAISDEMEAIF